MNYFAACAVGLATMLCLGCQSTSHVNSPVSESAQVIKETPPKVAPELEQDVQAKVYIDKYGQYWDQAFRFYLFVFDRRNGTRFSKGLVPRVVPASEALELLREGGAFVLGSEALDKEAVEMTKEPGAVGLYWEFPKDRAHYPKGVVFLPYPKDKRERSVGVSTILGLDLPSRGEPSPYRGDGVEIKDAAFAKSWSKESSVGEHLLILHVPGCRNTPRMLGQISRMLKGAKVGHPPVFVDDIRNHKELVNKHAPMPAGPMILFRDKQGQVKDLQYSGHYTRSLEHFMWRSGVLKEEPPLHDVWQKMKAKGEAPKPSTFSMHKDLTAEDLSGVDFGAAHLDTSLISGSSFQDADLSQVSMKRAFVYRSNFKGAKLSKEAIEGTIWVDSICPSGKPSDPETLSCF